MNDCVISKLLEFTGSLQFQPQPMLYAIIGLVTIPINSVLNPFLYSNLPELIVGKLCGVKIWIFTKIYDPCKFPLPRKYPFDQWILR